MMASGITLRNRLGRYLVDQITLDDLTESVVDAVWDIGPDQDDVDSRFAYAVQLALAELSDGLVTPEEFRSYLAQLLNPVCRFITKPGGRVDVTGCPRSD